MARKLPPGFTVRGTRLRGVCRVNGRLLVESFPLDTPNTALRQWFAAQVALRTTPQHTATGTLAADIASYVASFSAGTDRHEREEDFLQHWKDEPSLASSPRLAIKHSALKAVVTRWQDDGIPVGTINRWVTALRGLYTSFAKDTDDNLPNPAARLKKVKPRDDETDEDEAPIRAIESYNVVDAILACMPDRGRAPKGTSKREGGAGLPSISKQKTILTLFAYCGIPPAQIMRIVAGEDIRWLKPRAQVYIRPRRKGTGVEARWVELAPQATAALRLMVDHGFMGAYSNASMRKAWLTACAKYRQWQRIENTKLLAAGARPMPILPHYRVYDLRHTFITHALAAPGATLTGVQYLALHSRPEQTMRYAKAAGFGAGQQAVQAFAAHRGTLAQAAL